MPSSILGMSTIQEFNESSHVQFTPIRPVCPCPEESTLDALGHTLACSRIGAVIASFRLLEQRTRKLEIVLAVFLRTAMGLIMEEAIDDESDTIRIPPRFICDISPSFSPNMHLR